MGKTLFEILSGRVPKELADVAVRTTSPTLKVLLRKYLRTFGEKPFPATGDNAAGISGSVTARFPLNAYTIVKVSLSGAYVGIDISYIWAAKRPEYLLPCWQQEKVIKLRAAFGLLGLKEKTIINAIPTYTSILYTTEVGNLLDITTVLDTYVEPRNDRHCL